MCSLLGHDNTDIAVDVIEVLQELTDDDIDSGVQENEDEEDLVGDADSSSASRLAVAQLIDELVCFNCGRVLTGSLVIQYSSSWFPIWVG